MNVHESEKITTQLTRLGFERTETEHCADIIIFNTCCIRNTAEQKIISHIGETKKNPDKIICIVGCLSQRENTATMLKRKFPHIAIILGTHNLDDLGDKIKEYLEHKKNPSNKSKDVKKAPKSLIEIIEERTNQDKPITQNSREDCAYINITYGCENFCSYCIVPYTRGKLISRDIDIIKEEFNQLKDQNKLIYLLGQNVNSYKCPRTSVNFPTLLSQLCEIKGNYKLNFLSSHPKDFSTDLINVIANNPQIERNIHLPIQSGSDRILELMNRRYTVTKYEKIIENLRKRVPDVHITTDIICGFPSETEQDFEQTKSTIKRIKFNAAFIFPYSRRTGTKADTMPDQIDSKTKKARTTQLIALQREISKQLETEIQN